MSSTTVMSGYYEKKLSGERLRRCYEIASPRVRQYLEAEIAHVLARLGEMRRGEEPSRPAVVLELGCGYGRVLARLAGAGHRVVGIDTARAGLPAARGTGASVATMDAVGLGFRDAVFDAAVCIQNGICAFRVDPRILVAEALRVIRPGGRVLLSTYSDAFWPDRLDWFEAQAAEGLLGPIDHAATGGGTIVCTDGFRAGRLTPEDLRRLRADVDLPGSVIEVDDSSVFLELVKPA